MPLDLLKGTVQGAHNNALKNNMSKVVDPLQIQIDQLKRAILQYQADHQRHNLETPPPKYQNLKEQPNEDLITKEDANRQTSDPNNHDTPNFYPNLHHPMNRRRSLIIPPNNNQNRTPVITDVIGPTREELDIEVDIQQIPPPNIQSTSSMLRDSLANLAQTTTRMHQPKSKTGHGGPSVRLRKLPSNHDQPTLYQQNATGAWHNIWHPPMPFPPSAPPLTQPSTSGTKHRIWPQPKDNQPRFKRSTTRYPRGSTADQPEVHNGYTITRQIFTTPRWKSNQTIFIPSDEEEQVPTTDPLETEEEPGQPRPTNRRKNQFDDSKP